MVARFAESNKAQMCFKCREQIDAEESHVIIREREYNEELRHFHCSERRYHTYCYAELERMQKRK